jgi:hypothetical protein
MTATLAPTDAHRAAFFSARATMQTIEALYDLAMYASARDWSIDDLAPTSAALAAENDWDLLAPFNQLADQVTDFARDMPLSVLVRSDWHAPGSEFTPVQFELLLSTGGPAVRIIGDLDHHTEPYRPQLQYQDWGIPWTDHPESKVDWLEWFAGLFWYGD